MIVTPLKVRQSLSPSFITDYIAYEAYVLGAISEKTLTNPNQVISKKIGLNYCDSPFITWNCKFNSHKELKIMCKLRFCQNH